MTVRNERETNPQKKKGVSCLANISRLSICTIAVLLGACSIRGPLTVPDSKAVASTPTEIHRVANDLRLDHLSPINLEAVPTANDVGAAAESGNYTEAAWMLRRVLEAHPNHARAHYILAQTLVRQGKALSALGELYRAKEIAPSHPYTSADNFRRVEAYIVQSASTYRDRKALFTLGETD
jgi:hypothetical protein